MKALRLTEWAQEATILEVDEPRPGPGEVIVRVAGSGACHSDLHLMHDFPAGALPWSVPFTLGHENAGWVHALGPGATGWEIGEPVAVYGPWGCGRCHRCRQGIENYCEHAVEIGAAGGGLGRDGGMAELMVVPSTRLLVPLGDVDPVQAAPLTDAALTPYHAIKRSLHRLVPGSTAVIIGAGGLGHMAVQIARHLSPARIVAVDRNPAALELATSVGADHGVLAGDDAAAEITDLAEGRGADVVIDLVGSDDTLALAAAVARPMADVTLVGIAGGSHAFGFFTSAYEVSFASTYWGTLPELIEVVAMARAGHVRSHVQTFPLDRALDAYRAMHDGSLTGRAVITP